MRYAQTIGLIRLQRYVEARDLLMAIQRGNNDPRIALLYGFVLQKLGKQLYRRFWTALENEDHRRQHLWSEVFWRESSTAYIYHASARAELRRGAHWFQMV